MTKPDHPCLCTVCCTSLCLCSDDDSEPDILPDFDLNRFHRELEATGEASVLVLLEEEEDDDTACFLLSGKVVREH